MKLNKIEKIFIIVVILGLILVGGYFMFVHKYWAEIDKSKKTLESNQKELQTLNETLAPLRSGELDQTIKDRTKETIKLEGTFFPDLTTYETVESTLAYLEAHGFETHTISVSKLSTKELKLEIYNEPVVEYELKTLAQGANYDSDAPEKVEGEFMDGNKKYFVTLNSLTDGTITNENGEEIPKNKYSDQMKKVYKIAMCKLAASNNLTQKVGMITAEFNIKGKFKDYCELMDSIFSFDHRAMMLDSVIYPMSIKASEDKDKDEKIYVDETGFAQSGEDVAEDTEILVTDDTVIEQDITLMFLSVEPMNALKTVDVEGTDIVVNQRPAVYLQ